MRRPGDDAHPRARGERRPPDPAIRQRAEELAAAGMPIQMAMAVAHGKLTLNEALHKLARRDAVTRMMEKHALSRALATQVALGQASLEHILAERRFEQHRVDFRDHSVLTSAAASGSPLTLLLHGKRRVTGQILSVDLYRFHFRGEDGVEEEIHKLQAKLAFHPDAFKRLRKVLRTDKVLDAAPKPPVEHPQDRYGCSDRRLFKFLDARTEVQITLLEGEVLRAELGWFSRFEIGLKLKGDAEVVAFRHALHNLHEV
jgi:sRNA-binding regulator protein Hfq